MMLVRTSVGPSSIDGIGLFAAAFIPKGTKIWQFNPALDIVISEARLAASDPVTRDFVLTYAYLSKRSGHYVLCADNARFFNHSTRPNTVGISDSVDIETVDIAIRDIEAGEELTTNYFEFDLAVESKLHATWSEHTTQRAA